MRSAGWTFVILLAVGAAIGLNGLPTQKPALLNWNADDGKRAAELQSRGERREGKLVVLFTPAGAIDNAEEDALLGRLDRGVAELRAVIGTHDWQIVKNDKLRYYISEDRFVSHASGRAAVFIPAARVQDGRAPYLHEAAHELLSVFSAPIKPDPARLTRVRTTRPLWLSEGLADYVGLTAASRAGVPEGDVFNIGGLTGTDAACRDRLQGPRAGDVLPFIGNVGAPEALFTTERQEVAPTFYACGTSFTKFIVGRIGLPETIGLMPHILTGDVLNRIEQLSRTSMDTLRKEWRASIGAQ